MMIARILVAIFFTLELFSESFDFITHSSHPEIKQLHKRSLVSLNPLTAIKPANSFSFDVKQVNVAGQTISRSTPIIDGISTEGVGAILNKNRHKNQFYFTQFDRPKASYRLSAQECIEIAMANHGASTVTDPHAQDNSHFYVPVWLMHFGELRPSFKVRLPTISIYDLKDIYVDAETGEILKEEPSAQFVTAPARLFTYAPKAIPLSGIDLRSVTLTDLLPYKEGDLLRGQYVSVRTCCKYYTCPTEGPCTEDKKRCALKSHENALQKREIVQLPTQTLGLNHSFDLPEIVSVDAVRCTNLPFARANHKHGDKGPLGFFELPIDDGSFESEIDRFSEIQAYFSIMSFFNHIRALLNDNTWCLRKEAMLCNPDGSPKLNAESQPEKPYQVFVNQMIPDMKMDDGLQEDKKTFMSQVREGKGNEEDPIKLDQLGRIGNAAFVPALGTLKKNTPRADEILSDLIKPFDHNVFFQGDRDFAYDGDVVFHEFMHAVTTSLIGKIDSLGLDEWGINSEPGGLNESWSDYFAAAFNDDPMVGKYASTKDGFGEASLRNIDNTASCPNNVIGEIHNDGLIWSGALWEVRAALKKAYGQASAFEFDRAVLASLAQAKTTENFTSQSEKLLANMRIRDGLGPEAEHIAKTILEKRGIGNCFKAFTLSSVDNYNQLKTRIKNLLFVPSKTQIGLKNYAPSAIQLEIGVPAGAKSITLTWRQYVGASGALLGAESTPESTKKSAPLKVLTSLDTPISWKFKQKYALAFRKDIPLVEDPVTAYYQDGYWHAKIPLNLKRCDQRLLYASLLSVDFKYVLENISVSFDVDTEDDLEDCEFHGSTRNYAGADSEVNCATTKTNGFVVFTIFCMMTIRLVMRRRSPWE